MLAISDIHGNLPFLRTCWPPPLRPDDILVLVGDLVEKGPDSLTTLRFIMELAERNTVYCLRGNCDNLVSEFVAAQGEEERFYRHYVDVWRDRCLLVQMGHAAGFETRGPEELPALREVVRARFGPELAFLEAMRRSCSPRLSLRPRRRGRRGAPGGAGRLEVHEKRRLSPRDTPFGGGACVGHWPVTLYHPRYPPPPWLLAEGGSIACIDGGCSSRWTASSTPWCCRKGPAGPSPGSPTTACLAAGRPGRLRPRSADSVNIRWGRNALEVLERGRELSLCRHLETGRVLEVLTEYLYVDRE
ncbi:MAG: metallophosphoesterase [Flavonifractor plautii]